MVGRGRVAVSTREPVNRVETELLKISIKYDKFTWVFDK